MWKMGNIKNSMMPRKNLLIGKSSFLANGKGMLVLQKSMDGLIIVELIAGERTTTKGKFLFAKKSDIFRNVTKEQFCWFKV